MQRLIQMNVEKAGCDVITAGSGKDALDIIDRERIDLLLIDLVMPEMDGIATLRQLRARPHAADLPVIMLTGRGQSDVAGLTEELGVAAFLIKPFSPIKLQAETKRLLHGEEAP